MIESNLTVEIHRVRETASHVAYRERRSTEGLRIKRLEYKSQRCTMAAYSLLDAAPFSTPKKRCISSNAWASQSCPLFSINTLT